MRYSAWGDLHMYLGPVFNKEAIIVLTILKALCIFCIQLHVICTYSFPLYLVYYIYYSFLSWLFFRMCPNSDHDMFPHWLRIFDSVMGWVMIIVNVNNIIFLQFFNYSFR